MYINGKGFYSIISKNFVYMSKIGFKFSYRKEGLHYSTIEDTELGKKPQVVNVYVSSYI